ncbi:MAG: hypothetical protein Q9Q40_10170 [Acidobacteriota bacterium]|nr:hypothetical protein [Acidobacteriota bacterium]MDQ7088727.1 hypothetical protein [Acidobacteriota bacterium]
MTQRSVKKFFGLAILLAILLSVVPMASADLFAQTPAGIAGGSQEMPTPVAAPAQPPVDDSVFEFWTFLKPFLFGFLF